MKKSFFSSIVSQIILLIFVIVWIIPTLGLLISSFRDKDLLATSGWWTSLFTTEINEIYICGGGSQNKFDVFGRFFKCFEQCIEAVFGKHVHFIDEVNFKAATAGRVCHVVQ